VLEVVGRMVVAGLPALLLLLLPHGRPSLTRPTALVASSSLAGRRPSRLRPGEEVAAIAEQLPPCLAAARPAAAAPPHAPQTRLARPTRMRRALPALPA